MKSKISLIQPFFILNKNPIDNDCFSTPEELQFIQFDRERKVKIFLMHLVAEITG